MSPFDEHTTTAARSGRYLQPSPGSTNTYWMTYKELAQFYQTVNNQAMPARHYSNAQCVCVCVNVAFCIHGEAQFVGNKLRPTCVYQMYGGYIMLNGDVYAFIHTICVCFNLSIILHMKRIQMPTTQRNTALHSTAQRNAAQRNTAQHSATQHNATQPNKTQPNTTQHSTTQRNATQCNATQHNATHNTTQSADLLPLQDMFPTSRVERGPVRTVRSHAISLAVSMYIRKGYSYKLVISLRRPEPVTVQNFVTSSLYLRACCTQSLSRVYVHEKVRRKECVVLYLRATYTPTRIYVHVEESFISAYSSNNDPEYYTQTTLHQRTQRGTPPSKHDKRTHLLMILG